jgi:hypothetical protein
MAGFIRVQCIIGIISVAIPGIGFFLAFLGITDPLITSNVTTGSLIVCWFLMLTAPFILPGSAPITVKFTSIIIFWGLITVIFPIIWDFTWALCHKLVNGATADDPWLWYWWSYAVADTRFLRSDPLMIIVEFWSGILGFVHAYALYVFFKGNIKRAFYIALTAGCMQFYACSAFFGVEVINGFENIEPDFFSFYMKFWGLNGFWVIMPFIQTYFFLRLMRDPEYDVTETLNKYFRGIEMNVQ